MSKNDMIIFGYLWYLGYGFAGPVHSIDVLKGDDGIHRQATVDPQRSGAWKEKVPTAKGPLNI